LFANGSTPHGYTLTRARVAGNELMVAHYGAARLLEPMPVELRPDRQTVLAYLAGERVAHPAGLRGPQFSSRVRTPSRVGSLALNLHLLSS
jgi:hypothetical protein